MLLALPSAALAQSPCLPRDKMVDHLANRYNERPVSMGLEISGKLIELFTTADGSTWTLVMIMPDGPACVVAAGVEWMNREPVKETY